MQTGYDNFWMYQNNRPEPVHNLPKNDNYSHPVLTNNYKQMQNGRYTSNTYFTPSNNVARSQNGQYSSDPRCMWPSSVYSLPFNSSYASNFHSQMYPTQTNNFSYSPQSSQAKPAMRKSNLIEIQKNNYNQSNITTRHPPISNYTETDTARIRVKDVFTLNNNSVYNSVLENNVVQTHKSKQFEYPLNHASNNRNRTCDFQTNEPVLKHIPSSYAQREQPCLSDQQQFLQYSDIPYKQNAQFSAGSQVQSNGNVQMGSNLQSPTFNTRSVLAQMLNNKEVQNDFSNALEGNKTVTAKANETNYFSGLKEVNAHISTERNNNIDYCNFSKANEIYNSYNSSFNIAQDQNQSNLQNIDRDSLSQISSTEGSRIVTSNAVSRINSLENNTVNITIPHTGQSNFIQYNEHNSGDKDSNLSLTRLLEENKKTYTDALSRSHAQNYSQNNGTNSLHERGEVRRESSNLTKHLYNISTLSISNNSNSTTKNSNNIYCNTNMTSVVVPSTPNSRLEPGAAQNHSESFLNSKDFSENTSTGNKNVNEFSKKSQAGSMSCEEIMAIKQEHVGVEDPNTQFQQNITIEEEIKTEKYSEHFDIEQQSQSSGNLGLPSKDISSNKKEESATSKKIVGKSKLACENSDLKLEIPRTLNKESEKNSTEHEGDIEKAKEKNYVSKINRDKLDLLIQFLKKEDENKTKNSEKNDSSDSSKGIIDEMKKNKEITSTRSRRKLCKTDIVKNKNNSREMVSLRSHKTSRVEVQDSLKQPRNTRNDSSSEKEDEKKNCSGEVNKNEKVVGFSEDAKPYNTSQDTKEQKSSDLKSEPEFKNTSVNGQTKENSADEEKNIINIMQALQNLKTHFCLSCTLVSPVDSFWINVVSGELRCLNCFKKMNLKIDDNVLKLKRTCNDDCSKHNDKPPSFDQTQKGSDNKKDSTENTCDFKCETELTKVNEERSCASKPKDTEMYDATSRNKSSEVQMKMEESEEKSYLLNDDIKLKSEDTSNVEMKTKRKLSVKEEFFSDKIQDLEEKTLSKIRKKSNSEDSQGVVNSCTKQWEDSPRKKTTKIDEKVKAHYEKKKPSSQLAEKGTAKEPYTKTSRESLEEVSEKSVNQLKEEDVSEPGKRDKKHSGQCRKRSSSKEEVGHYKSRISEEEVVSAIKSPSRECCDSSKLHTINELSDKSRSFSNEICTDQKSKISKHSKTSLADDSETKNLPVHRHLEKSIEQPPKKRKKSFEEDLVPRKVYIAEDTTKYPKQCFEKSKTTNSTKGDDNASKHKTPEHSKHHVFDFDLPRRKSKDEGLASKNEMKNFTDSDKTRRNSTSKENLSSPQPKKELKYKRLILENYEKDRKSFFGKIPKISRKSKETVASEANKSPQNDDKFQKSSSSSKPLKESQRTEDEVKTATLNETFNKKKESYDNKHRHKEPHKSTEKKKNETIIRDEKKEKFNKSKKEKALECVYGKKKEDLVLKEHRKMSPEKPPSAKLLEKLFEKTKKLSWSLLGES